MKVLPCTLHKKMQSSAVTERKHDYDYNSTTDPACDEGAVPGSSDHADQRRDDVKSSTNGSADEILQREERVNALSL